MSLTDESTNSRIFVSVNVVRIVNYDPSLATVNLLWKTERQRDLDITVYRERFYFLKSFRDWCLISL
jgi:hypothetical protein